jgi:hypothetical protein
MMFLFDAPKTEAQKPKAEHVARAARVRALSRARK